MFEQLLLENKTFFSKSLKRINSSLGYRNEIEKKLQTISQYVNKDKSRNFYLNQKNNTTIQKSIQETEQRKVNNTKFNLYQSYEFNFIPRIRPNILNLDKYLIKTNKKSDKFIYKASDESKKQANTKIITKIKLNNFNKLGIKEKIKAKSTEKNKNDIKDIKVNDIEDDDSKDIFDKNYKYEVKKSKEFIHLKQRIQRIINENKKVKKKFNINQIFKSKLKQKMKSICNPNYESIEKHIPEISLNNSSRRIFPFKYIKKSYYFNSDICPSIIEKGFKFNKSRSTKAPNKRNTFYICSSLSCDNIFFSKNAQLERNKFKNMQKNNFSKLKDKNIFIDLKNDVK